MSNQEPQWTLPVHLPPEHSGSGEAPSREDLLSFLEAELDGRMKGAHAVILPSGRAALGLILRTLGLGRGDAIAAPRWSSACIWSTLGRFSCPTIDFRSTVAASIVVHRYGYSERCPTTPTPTPVIEDSCDSLFTDHTALFPNCGVAELVSLPKILGTYAGGLLWVSDLGIAATLRATTREFSSFNESQGRLRWQAYAQPAPNSTWDHLEFRNYAPDLPTLKSIQAGLIEWDHRAGIIQERLQHVSTKRPDLWESTPFKPSPGRLPGVLPIPVETLDQIPGGLAVRRMNTSRDSGTEVFQPMVLLPLHTDYTESAFHSILARLSVHRRA